MIQFAENISLKKYNTFGVNAHARYFVSVSAYEELVSLIKNFDPGENRHLIIGSGSNLLFTTHFDGWVLHNNIRGIRMTGETENEVFITAGSGEKWSHLVDFTVSRGWGGLENLSLIPGTVGAAPVQNIGAYGTEQKDAFVRLEACNLFTGKICQFNAMECDFGYRHSIFKADEKGKWFVLNVTYRLKKNPVPVLDYAPLRQAFRDKNPGEITIKAVSEVVKKIRGSKLPDPETLGNAGSFFKNPVVFKEKFQQLQKQYPNIPSYPAQNGKVKIPAGWLIEQTGWKGRQRGHAGVHHAQALVLVNLGKATGQEIWELAQNIQEDVFQKFGIRLEPEVLIL